MVRRMKVRSGDPDATTFCRAGTAARRRSEPRMKTAVTLACFSVLLSGAARGDEIEIGSRVVCNTQKQIEEFVAFNEADPQTAIRDVNVEEENPTACGAAKLAFFRGRNTVTIRTKDATFQIIDILVIGLVTEHGLRSVAPSVQFALFKIDERIA
jgi:hypothetical protein